MSASDVNDLNDVDFNLHAIASHEVGNRIRGRRTAMRLSLREVSERTGLSQAYISQLELGKYAGSITALQKISSALGVSVGSFFAQVLPDKGKIDGRRAGAVAFGEGATKIRLTPDHFNSLEVFMGFFEPGGSTSKDPYTHGDSDELVLVLQGRAFVEVADETFELGTHEAAYYRSREPHRLYTTYEGATVLWTISPPSY